MTKDELDRINRAEEFASSYTSDRGYYYEGLKEGYLAGLKDGSQLDKVWCNYDAGEDCYEDSHEGRWVKREVARPKWHKIESKVTPKREISKKIYTKE